MSFSQVVVLAIVALIAAAVTLLLVPRQKRALPFEIVMWLAGWVVAGLCAWVVLGAVESFAALRVLELAPIAGIPILPLALGAFAGALVLTVPLWLMDRFGSTDEEPINEAS